MNTTDGIFERDYLSRLGQAPTSVVMGDIRDQSIGVGHQPERNFLRAKEVERDGSVIPTLLATAEILPGQVVVWKAVSAAARQRSSRLRSS
jgi:hypothetical protein